MTRTRELVDSVADNIEKEQAVDDAMYAVHGLLSALKYKANAKNMLKELAA